MAIIRPHIMRNDNAVIYKFIRLQGAMAAQTDQLDVIERPGIDGAAARRMGKKSPATFWRALVDVKNADQARQLTDDLRALQGQVVSIKDEIGNTEPNVLVLRAEPLGTARRIIGAVGGIHKSRAKFLLEFRFQMKLTEIP